MKIVALAVAVLLVACGGQSASEPQPAETTTTTEATTPADTSAPVADETIVIEATAGVDAGTEHAVPLGAQVRLVLVNEVDHDEFHLHGYDLLAMVEAGEEGVIEFVADTAGRFELESHETGDLLLVLVVS